MATVIIPNLKLQNGSPQVKANMLNKILDIGNNLCLLNFSMCRIEHVSIGMLAFSSKHPSAKVQLHRAASAPETPGLANS